MEIADLIFGKGDQLDAGEYQPLVDRDDVGLVLAYRLQEQTHSR